MSEPESQAWLRADGRAAIELAGRDELLPAEGVFSHLEKIADEIESKGDCDEPSNTE